MEAAFRGNGARDMPATGDGHHRPAAACDCVSRMGKYRAGRSERIRTSDPVVPNDVRYQTALHSVTSGASIDRPNGLRKRQNPKENAFL